MTLGSKADRAEIVRGDKAHVWHPYTPMDRYIAETDPFVVVRAEGPRFFDADGRGYLDANSSWWVALLGHNHPRLVAALKRQADAFCHVSLAGVTHAPAAELAEALTRIAPKGNGDRSALTRVFLSDDGSTAVEAAIKMAAQFWRNEGAPEKRRFVALDGAFHGETIGAASLGGIEVFRRPFGGVLFDCLRVPSPADAGDDRAAFEATFDALEGLLRDQGHAIAAIVLEPCVQGAAGMRMYSAEYLRRARAACDAANVLLIADEVFTGYGRTGPFWSCDAAGIAPDVLCTAKGFSGGMLPMAATLATERVFNAFRGADDRAFFYGHSFAGNPLGAAVALEVLAIYADEAIVLRAQSKARRIADAFAKMSEIQGVLRSRSLGMIGAIDLDTSAAYLGRRGWRVHEEARRRGAYLRPLGDVVYIAPPLNIPDEDLDALLAIVEESVRAAT